MAKTYVVQQGDHLTSIAADNGFLNFETVWNDPNNAELKKLRDPHVLFPGDEVFIPDLVVKDAPASTTTINRFVVAIQRLFLRLKVLDLDNQPIKNAACELKVESEDKVDGTTDGQGFVQPDKEIAPSVREAALSVHIKKPTAKSANPPPPDAPLKFDVKVGHMNPEKKLSGQQARLNNLGYFAGYTLNDLEQLLWAAEEFSCDHLGAPVAARPKLQAVKPADQIDGQESGDSPAETGIQDQNLRGALRTFHGS